MRHGVGAPTGSDISSARCSAHARIPWILSVLGCPNDQERSRSTRHATSRRWRRPSADDIAHELNADSVTPLPLPWDFTDGVFPAYWRRPAAYLNPQVRRSCSALAQTDPDAVGRGIRRLRYDLDSGRWHARHQDLLELDEWDAGFRLIVSHS